MKTFQIITLFALVAASMAFAPNQAPQSKFCESVPRKVGRFEIDGTPCQRVVAGRLLTSSNRDLEDTHFALLFS